MKKIILSMTVLGIAGLIPACAPQGAQQPLPPEQEYWAKSFESCYPSWQRPKVVAPYTPVPQSELAGTYEPHRDVIATVSHEPVAVAQPPAIIKEEVIVPVAIVPVQTPAVVIPAPAVVGPTIKNPSILKDGKYQVQANDSFWKIAVKVYGNGTLAKKIQEANPEVAQKKYLRPGSWLIIPGQPASTPTTPVVVETIVEVPVAPVAPVADTSLTAPAPIVDSPVNP